MNLSSFRAIIQELFQKSGLANFTDWPYMSYSDDAGGNIQIQFSTDNRISLDNNDLYSVSITINLHKCETSTQLQDNPEPVPLSDSVITNYAGINPSAANSGTTDINNFSNHEAPPSNTIKDFLISEGFEDELIESYVPSDICNLCSLYLHKDQCASLFSFMRAEEFDDWFILVMFSKHKAVFECSESIDRLLAVKEHFNNFDLWYLYIEGEYDKTGTSSVFEHLMPCRINDFKAKIAEICENVKSVFVDAYGSIDDTATEEDEFFDEDPFDE